MKKILLLSFLSLFVWLNSCNSQKLVQKSSDIYKIKTKEDLFIGKSLKILLKEINLPIRRVMAQPSVNTNSSVGYFIFNFMDNRKIDSLRSKGKIPATIVVYVKEYFEWDFQKRPKGKETIWTSLDEKKYENLTIVGFRIYGDTTVVH